MALLSTVKKNLVLDIFVEEAWFHCLANVDDDLGREAFALVMRQGSNIFGDVEPGHILDAAETIAHERFKRDSGEWINSAKSNRDDDDWRQNESKRSYKATDSAGVVYLVQNPGCWKYYETSDGRRTYIRPRPIPTNEKIKTEQKKRASHG